MRVVIAAKKFNTYSSRRIAAALEAGGHRVDFVSPLDCALKIDGGQVDIITPGLAEGGDKFLSLQILVEAGVPVPPLCWPGTRRLCNSRTEVTGAVND